MTINASSDQLAIELLRLSNELAQAAGDESRVLQIAERLSALGTEITAACEREFVRATEIAAA